MEGYGVRNGHTADVLIIENVVRQPGEIGPLVRCTDWDGNDGLGNPVPLTSPITVFLDYFQGVVHFPVYDVEYQTIGLQINPIRPVPIPGFVVEPRFDDTKIPEDRFSGANDIELDGCTMPCHNWTAFDFGNLNTISTWWFMSEKSTSSNIIPNCCPVAECIPLEIIRFIRQ